MPASLRAHVSRTTPSRPYDRRSSSASPAESEPPHFSWNLPPAEPIRAIDADPDASGTGIPPDHPGLPTYDEYKRIESGYLHSLSPRKRDKALITQAMFDKIWDVLHQPEACTVETPQFRFWVRKMFTLNRQVWAGEDGWGEGTDADEAARELAERSMLRRTGDDISSYTAVVLHEHRPVAIMEQLYELFCYCHVRAGHGGRDKTCAVIREHYSWVPKELTAQFVKACPTCAVKRSGQLAGGVGVQDMVQRKAVGRGGRKGHTVPLEAEAGDTPAMVEYLGLGWPTTGGPLDPANPEPCGIRKRGREREREREREDEWLRARGSVGPTNPVSPDRSAPTDLLENYSPNGWGTSTPCGMTPAMSPLYGCNVTRSPEHPLATDNSNLNARQTDQERDARSSAQTGLPSLASALSDESLDEDVNLTSPGPGPRDAAECLLPSVLRPLRLLGPVAPDTVSDPRSSYPLQIDPALLSFDYPGPGLSSESASVASEAMIRPGLSLSAASTDHHSLCPGRLGTSSSPCMDIPLLDPESSFEHGALAAYTTIAGDAARTGPLPLSSSTELAAGRWTRPRCGPFDVLYQWGDEVGHFKLDGPISIAVDHDGCMT